jgi:hypothetical protein
MLNLRSTFTETKGVKPSCRRGLIFGLSVDDSRVAPFPNFDATVHIGRAARNQLFHEAN